MMQSRVHVIPGVFGTPDFLDVFEEMWETMGAVSRLPECLVTGDFPPTNILVDDKDENYVIQMSVAGYPENGVDISFKDDYLTVKLNPDEHMFDGYKVKMKGFRTSKAERRIYVPAKEFDINKADAETSNGVLTIKIPRKPESKPFNINIKKT